MHNREQRLKRYGIKALKIFAWIIGILLLLFISIVLLVRSPWGQSIIVSKATEFVSDKIDTPFSIDRLFITFSGNVFLEGLYLEDQQGDTLVYSEGLEGSVALLPIIYDNTVNIDLVDWDGLTAHVTRSEKSGKFNFDYLIEAFSAPNDSTAPDTTSVDSPLKIDIGRINFTKFNLSYLDGELGIDTYLKLGELSLKMNELDLDQLLFDIEEVTLKDIEGFYKQTKSTEDSSKTTNDTTSTLLPTIKVDEFNIYNFKALYHSPITNFIASGNIGELELELPIVDLNKQKIELDRFLLANTEASVEMYAADSAATPADTSEVSNFFTWPDWLIEGNDIVFEQVNFQLKLDTAKAPDSIFTPSQIGITGLSLNIATATLKDEEATFELKSLKFKERSGFNLKDLAFDLNITDQHLKLHGFSLLTDQTTINSDIEGRYSSINSIISSYEALTINTNLSISASGLNDIYYFSPELKSNPSIAAISQKDLALSTQFDGTAKELSIDNLDFKWSNSTYLIANGKSYNLTEPDKIWFENLSYKLETTKSDVYLLADLDSFGIELPETITLTGATSGTTQKITTDNTLITSLGDFKFDGFLTRSGKETGFDLGMEIDSLLIGELLRDNRIGPLTMSLQASGNGSDLNSLDARLKSEFQSLNYDGYDFTALKLKGEMHNGNGKVEMTYNDENLQMNFLADLKLDSIQSSVNTEIDIEGADLMRLGITKKDVRIQCGIVASYNERPDTMDAQLEITNGIIVHNKESYQIGSFKAEALVMEDSTSAKINSDIIKAELQSNTNPAEFISSIEFHLKRYLNPDIKNDTLPNDVKVSANLTLGQNILINEVLASGLERYDSIFLHTTFDESNDSLVVFFAAPYVNYNGTILDSLKFNITAVKDKFKFHTGWNSIVSDPLNIEKTSLSGTLNDKVMNVKFQAMNDQDSLIIVNSELKMTGDTLLYHIEPDTLIFNRKIWTIPPGNQLKIAKEFVDFKEFNFTRNGQKFALESTYESDHKSIEALFDGFKLYTLTSFLNPKDTLANGLLKGNFTILDPFDKSAILADLSISDLNTMGANLGTLTLKGSSESNNLYQFNLALKEGAIDLDLNGNYVPDKIAAQVNLDLAISKMEASVFGQFLGDYIEKPSGYLSGKLKINGTTSEPKYSGKFDFNEFGLFVSTLSTKFIIDNNELTIDNSGIYFDNFTINDMDNNAFHLDGEIATKSLLNPTFNLALSAKNFQMLNSDKKDNEMYYGKAGLNMDLTIKGDLAIPVIRGSLGIEKGSNVTVIVPESQVDLVEREGVVHFINKKEPDNILTRKEETTSIPQTFKGIDLNTVIHIGKDATFKIVIDERTGDNFQISGVGDFNVGLEPNGRTTLAGNYNVSGGHFEASLYNIVKRRFEMAEGSVISWSGDPLEASLEVKAIYKVKASAAPLMATQTSSASANTANQYQQQLPFQVYININGSLLQPELSFALDMPEKERGVFGGDVYNQVQQLNSNEEQLNKQVFSLLVLNRFYPASGSDGSSGGATSIARNNVNKVLSSQLNSLSNKITGSSGFQLNFGLNSYTDYQGSTAQDRTDLNINASQRLFNDRVIVQVGSDVNIEGSGQEIEESSPLIGNVSLEYLVTENGRYRLRGFRKNEYQNIIDGQLIVTGFAFIFTREFNRFKEIWQNARKEEMEELKDDEN